MSLPRRQQRALDQIEQALQAADPRLKAMFAWFGCSTRARLGPSVEAISGHPSRRTVVIFMVVVVFLLGVLIVDSHSVGDPCPALSSGRAAAPAAARFADCVPTGVWSRGGR
jgi:hypothetical protein